MKQPKAYWIDARASGALSDYPAGTILVTEAGSGAHGTGIPGGEDHDETVVFIPSANQMLGVDGIKDSTMWRTKPEGARSGPGDIDRQIYSLRKFIALALAGNPSILMTFWAPALMSHPIGRRMRELGPAFVGRHIVPRYRGYMMSQLDKLDGRKARHGKRGSGQRDELIAEHGYDTKFAMHAARLGYQGIELITTQRLRFPIEGEAGDWLRSVRRGEIPYAEWRQRLDQLDADLSAYATNAEIRKGPDVEAINDFCISAYKDWWGWR